MTAACIKAAKAVKQCGSSEAQAVMRMLLYLLGTEAAQREGLGEHAAMALGEGLIAQASDQR